MPRLTSLERHRRDLYTELAGTRENWAPYYVREVGDGEYAVFHQEHRVATARLSGDRSTVVDLYVAPEHRRRGVASALVAYLESVIGAPLAPGFVAEAGRRFWRSRRA